MKKLLLIVIYLCFSSKSYSLELTISCLWNEQVFYDEKKNKKKSKKIYNKEFFYINTNFNFFGNPRNYGSLSDHNNEFNKHDFFEYKDNIFFKLSDLSGGKRKHYFTTKYNLVSGKITDKFVNLNPNFGKIQSTIKYGNCEEVIFKNCENERILICSGNYENFNKITKETIKYKKEKNFFLCKNRKFYLKSLT